MLGMTQNQAALTAARLPTTDDITAHSEREVILQAQQGSIAAFEQLVNRYERRIFRLARTVTRLEDTEDIVQNVFVKAFRHLPEFRGDSRFYTWLSRITINEALMKMRKRRWNEVSINDSPDDDRAVTPRELMDWGPGPEQRYSENELKDILAGAMSKLKPPYRAVFQLRHVDEFSIQETAGALGLSCSAVKARFRRARRQLRNLLNNTSVNSVSQISSAQADVDNAQAAISASGKQLADESDLTPRSSTARSDTTGGFWREERVFKTFCVASRSSTFR